MSASILQQGTKCLVGFGVYQVAGYFMDTVNDEHGADIDEVRDENNAMAGKAVSNPHQRLRLNMVIKQATDISALKQGYGVTINSIVYFIETAPVIDRVRTYNRVSFTAVKEDSMTYDLVPTA